jgi:hypothetical protein
LSNINLIQAGVGSQTGILAFSSDLKEASRIDEDGDIKVNVIALDEELAGKRITFLKMDIEGSELAALKGAANIISSQKPKLVICLYHRYEDIWQIPAYIWSLYSDYTFYIRHYSNSTETVLYAVP